MDRLRQLAALLALCAMADGLAIGLLLAIAGTAP